VVLDLGEPLLAMEIERHVSKVRLDLRERDPDRVLVPVLDLLERGQLEVVFGLDLEDVGQQVLAFEDEVLNNEIGWRGFSFPSAERKSSAVQMGIADAYCLCRYTRFVGSGPRRCS
jgi:hypothetical protein